MSEHLVVASKVKAYIRQKKGMNTSASALEALTQIVERECDKAMDSAEKHKRKTVMDRDFNSSEF